MADEKTTTDTTASDAATTVTTSTAVTQPPEQPKERLFTQDEVNRIVGERVAKEKAARPKESGKAPTDDERFEQLLSRERAFTRATVSAGLTDRQTEIMGQALKHANPERVVDWCADYLEGMGLGKKVQTTTTSQTTEQVKPAPSAPTAPAKVDPLTAGGLVDIFNLTPDQLSQLGPAGVRGEFEKILAAGRRVNGAPPKPASATRR